MANTQDKLNRVRAPRVQITYDVETNGAIEKRDLPFVMGVLGDFTGQRDPENPLQPLKEREFIDINPDTFDDVLKGMSPRVSFSVENKLTGGPSGLKVDLSFKKMEDFSPEKVAEQVQPLKDLISLRSKLSDLRGSLQGNDQLDQLLFEAISNTEQKARLAAEMKTAAQEDNG